MDPIVLTASVVSGCVVLGYIVKVVTDGVTEVLAARRSDRSYSESNNIDDRLSRLESSIDAVALELERVGELQRFTAQISAGTVVPLRLAPPLALHSDPAVHVRAVTPH